MINMLVGLNIVLASVFLIVAYIVGGTFFVVAIAVCVVIAAALFILRDNQGSNEMLAEKPSPLTENELERMSTFLKDISREKDLKPKGLSEIVN